MNKCTNIMLIDDNKMDLFRHQKVIEKYNPLLQITAFSNPVHAIMHLEVLNATTGRQAKDFPHIIFLDINMPEMNGFQFLEALLKLKILRKNKPRIFLLSSSNMAADMRMAGENEYCAEYINKPLTFEKIATLLAPPKPILKDEKELQQLL